MGELRRTGRTTRMLKKAFHAGDSVIVVTHNGKLPVMEGYVYSRGIGGFNVLRPDGSIVEVCVIRPESRFLSWHPTPHVLGSTRPVFVDHYVWELRASQNTPTATATEGQDIE